MAPGATFPGTGERAVRREGSRRRPGAGDASRPGTRSGSRCRRDRVLDRVGVPSRSVSLRNGLVSDRSRSNQFGRPSRSESLGRRCGRHRRQARDDEQRRGTPRDRPPRPIRARTATLGWMGAAISQRCATTASLPGMWASARRGPWPWRHGRCTSAPDRRPVRVTATTEPGRGAGRRDVPPGIRPARRAPRGPGRGAGRHVPRHGRARRAPRGPGVAPGATFPGTGERAVRREGLRGAGRHVPRHLTAHSVATPGNVACRATSRGSATVPSPRCRDVRRLTPRRGRTIAPGRPPGTAAWHATCVTAARGPPARAGPRQAPGRVPGPPGPAGHPPRGRGPTGGRPPSGPGSGA